MWFAKGLLRLVKFIEILPVLIIIALASPITLLVWLCNKLEEWVKQAEEDK